MRRGFSRIAPVVVLALAGCMAPEEAAGPETPASHRVVDAETLAWTDGPASLPVGARMAALSGNASAAEAFTLRFEVPPGYVVPPHTHPATETVTVLQGSATVGLGPDMDAANGTALTPGDLFVMPPGMAHWFVAGDETVVLQLHGTGPWGIEYVDPADDPRGAR